MELTNNDKIKLIDKYNKKNMIFMKLLIESKDLSLYIILEGNKKKDRCRLSWFELSAITSKDIDKYLSCIYIPPHVINFILDKATACDVDLREFNSKEKGYYNIYLESNIITKVNDSVNIMLKNRIPEEMGTMYTVITTILNLIPPLYRNMPINIIEGFVPVNINTDDINALIPEDKLEECFNYYKADKILFVEAFSNQIMALVEDDDEYLVTIDFNNGGELERVYSTCHCEDGCKHVYAVLKAYQDKKFKPFYKISHINLEEELVDRLLNLNFALCIGIKGDNYELVTIDGDIVRAPILNENGEKNWIILEDSKDHKLEKALAAYLKNK